MRSHFINRTGSILISSLLFIIPVSAHKLESSGQKSSGETQQKKVTPKPLTDAELEKLAATKSKPPSGASFFMAPIVDQPGNFTVLVTDDNGINATDQISTRELPVLEAILDAAKAFALTNEAVGQKQPETTRFSDDQLPRYTVDVAKVGNRSQFILKFNGLMGKVTLDAGSIKRTDREPNVMFHDILNIVKKAIAGEQNPQTTIKFRTYTQQENHPTGTRPPQ
jgi:hypothetical protein